MRNIMEQWMECKIFTFEKWKMLSRFLTGFWAKHILEQNMEMDSKESKKREKQGRNGTYSIESHQ